MGKYRRMSIGSKLGYLAWAFSKCLFADTACPACGAKETNQIRRKYLVTSLRRCESCSVMFRIPKPNPNAEAKFYQKKYTEGITSDCPTLQELDHLKSSHFIGSQKDFSSHLEVLRALKLLPGSSVYDFGSSWGYASWQLREAGYRVFSYEISAPRARYAVENMGCSMYVPDELPDKVDCIFSSHVIEHLCNPRMIWEVAEKVLKPTGVVIFFCPNGNLSRDVPGAQFHKLWGRVHPLLLDPSSMEHMANLYGFEARCYSCPYDLVAIGSKGLGNLDGWELLAVAHRRHDLMEIGSGTDRESLLQGR